MDNITINHRDVTSPCLDQLNHELHLYSMQLPFIVSASYSRLGDRLYNLVHVSLCVRLLFRVYYQCTLGSQGFSTRLPF